MKPLLVALALLVPSVLVAADPPRPGTAAWNRKFRELNRQVREMRRKSGSTSSTVRNGSEPVEPKSPTPAEERLRANMTDSQTCIYDDASKPRPFDEKNAPSADACLQMFRDAINRPEPFPVQLQYLAAEHRREYVRRQADPNHFKHGQCDQDFMACWRRVVGHVTKVDSVRAVDGLEDCVDVSAWVQAPDVGEALYRFRMAGEGRFYRLREYRVELIRVNDPPGFADSAVEGRGSVTEESIRPNR